MSDYKVTIGLEIHVALKTKSKLFSRSACDFELDKFSYFDAGIPGMLPVLSEDPVKMALTVPHISHYCSLRQILSHYSFATIITFHNVNFYRFPSINSFFAIAFYLI